MQNDQVGKAIPWNPWHGCKKVSPGCKNCFVYKQDRRYGRDTTKIEKGKTTYELKDKNVPPHSLIKLCFVGGEMAPKADVRPIEYEWVKALYLEARERNIEFYFHQCGSMFLRDGKNIGKWNLNEQIKRAEEIQHELEETF